MSACKSCKAVIYWVMTESGKSMPVDPPNPDGNVKVWRDPDDGRLRSGMNPPDGVRVNRTTSHYATCPDADTWRKP